MLFNSIQFLIYFPLVVILYYAIPHKWRWLLLVTASYYFYMCWKAEYIFLILLSTFIDYFAAIRMAKMPDKKGRKKYLLLSIFVNLGLLFSFKYFNFINESLRDVFNNFNIFYDVPTFKVLLPVGISFYTFQTLSYTIDVYRGRTQPERHFGRFALYVSFFPQLVAGPIERSIKLLPELRKKVQINGSQILSGLKLMFWGFFKKVVIADRLAIYVGSVFLHPDDVYGPKIILAAVFLHVQVYADLSGYTDIARGAARVMGIDLIKNFNNPLWARSLYDFWKRWHISLTTWFTDYLYIPLGGNRVIKWRWYYNIFIVFLISGLWHGASWTFVIWGAMHGLFQLIEIWTDKPRKAFFKRIGISDKKTLMNGLGVTAQLTMLSATALFFGAKNMGDASTLIRNIADFSHVDQFVTELYKNLEYTLSLILVVGLMSFEWIHAKFSIFKLLAKQHMIIRLMVYAIGILLTITFGVFKDQEFIYFQF